MNAYEIAKTADDAVRALSFKELGRDEWRRKSAVLEANFAEDLAAAFPTPIPELVFDRAWSDGHSSGFYEVAYKYEALASLVQAAAKAAP